MSPGLIVALILVVGVGLVAATIADRRAERKLQPGTERPAAATGNSAATDPPAYVTSQHHDNAGPAAAFSLDEERTLASQPGGLHRQDRGTLGGADAGHPHGHARDPGPAAGAGLQRHDRAVAREVMALLATASADKALLLIAAPNIDVDVRSTCCQPAGRRMEVTVVLGEPDAIAQLASALWQEPTTLADRQAGIRPADLPHPSRIGQ